MLANDCERRNAPAGNGGGVVVTTGADMKPKRGWPLGITYAGAPASTGGVVPTLSASSLSSTEVLYCKGELMVAGHARHRTGGSRGKAQRCAQPRVSSAIESTGRLSLSKHE